MAKTINAFYLPHSGHPQWFPLRERIILAMIDIEMDRRVRNSGINLEGLICMVAPLVGIEINTVKEYEYVEPRFAKCREMARYRMKRIREEHGGQWLVFPTGLPPLPKPPKGVSRKPKFPPRRGDARYCQQLTLELPYGEDEWTPEDQLRLLDYL